MERAETFVVTFIEKTTFEQRKPMYKQVEELLVPGFLSHSIGLNGVPVSVRSLGATDYFLLSHKIGPSKDTRTFYSWLVASSCWMIGGLPTLGNHQAQYEMFQTCMQIPTRTLMELAGIVTKLWKKASEASDYLEAFLYERESRYLWRVYGTNILERTGIPAAESLGLNSVQKIWISFNVLEDDRESYQREWANAKLIAAAHAPKGVQKINRADEQALREELERREHIQDVMFSQWMGYELDLPEGSLSKSSRFKKIMAATTPEELEEQMYKDRMGIKDAHDLIVDSIKAQMRAKVEREREAQRQRVLEAQKALEQEGISESLQPLLMSSEDIARRFEGRRGSRVFEGTGSQELYDKYLSKEVVTGGLSFRGDSPIALPDQSKLMGDLQKRLAKGDEP